jgi:2-hydroxychromene-2-carboxylate isomerase
MGRTLRLSGAGQSAFSDQHDETDARRGRKPPSRRLRPLSRDDLRRLLGQGLNLGDEAVFAGVLESTGLPAKRILAEIETPAIKDELRANTDGAVARGMFGAPTFFVGDEMFWGNDRLDWVEEALNRQR